MPDDLEDDELEGQPRIARPPAPSTIPPVTLRGLGSPAAPASPVSTEELEAEGLASHTAPRPIATPSPLEERTTADQGELSRLQTSGSGVSQIAKAHPVAGGILRGLSTAGSILGAVDPFARRILPNIPGTEEHHNQLIRRQTGRIGEDLGEAKETAATGEAQARTDQATAAAEKDRAEADKARQSPVEKPTKPEPVFDKAGNIIGFNSGTDLLGLNNPGLTPDMKAMVDAAKVKEPADGTMKVTRVINGVPHEVLVNSRTGEDIKDEGQTKVPGESAGAKRTASESAQVEREARVEIRKASDKYRDTKQSVDQLNASIDAAKDGNGLLTSFVPTMEVLGINASNGVHRISPAEAQAAGMPGGWAERFNAWFDKAATGKLSPELQTEGKALAKILSDSAYRRYKSTYDSESGIVSGYGGEGFNQRVPLIQQEGAGGAGGGTVNMKAPDGTIKPVPADQVDHYKSRGATVAP